MIYRAVRSKLDDDRRPPPPLAVSENTAAVSVSLAASANAAHAAKQITVLFMALSNLTSAQETQKLGCGPKSQCLS